MLSAVPEYSFIIPTLGRRENLITIIEKIEKILRGKYEIIIVHDDIRTAILQEAAKHSNVVLIRNMTGNRNSGNQRNIGAQAAVNDVLVFMDDDVDPQESFLRFLASEPDISGIMFPEIITDRDVPFPLGDHVSGKALVTACVVMKRDVFDGVGQFNTELINYREDTEFFIRATKKSVKISFMDGGYVKHPVRYTTFKTFRSFFFKNEQEPLFHKLVNGRYNGILQSKPLSSTANRYGFSVASYLFIFLIALILSSAVFHLLLPIMVILLLFAIFLAAVTFIWSRKGPEIRRRDMVKFFQNVLFIAFIVTIIPARILGSIRYRHFTL